jgi:hypothetical protein
MTQNRYLIDCMLEYIPVHVPVKIRAHVHIKCIRIIQYLYLYILALLLVHSRCKFMIKIINTVVSNGEKWN